MSPKHPKPENCIYKGYVYHARHTPFFHDYKYKVFGFFVNLDELPRLNKLLKFFSFNYRNICSLYNKDHGPRDGTSLREWIEDAGRDKNIDLTCTNIFMLVFPRVWGHVFNPITLYFCYTPDNKLKAVMYEVKNTFGEQHGYLREVEDSDSSHIYNQRADKVFHVSPFIHMDCQYRFRFEAPGDNLNFAIHQFTHEPAEDGKILTAIWTGRKKALTDKNILKTAMTMPFMTLKVVGAIHWQALRLWLKGAKYIKKPHVPEKDVT